MSLQSPCSIVFTPTGGAAATLVAVGDWLSAHPHWQGAQNLFEKDGVLAAAAYFAPLGGAVIDLTITREMTKSTRLAAQEAMLDAALPLTGTLVISSATQSATYTPAVIVSLPPGLPSGPEVILTLPYAIRAAIPTIAAL